MIKKIAFLFLLVFCQVSFAKVKLPAIIADNMVLQQKSKTSLWGQSAADAQVKITTSWDQKDYTVIANANGKWILNLKTPKAGGPYTISFSDKDGAVNLENVFIGEVWLCSGQSNMEMPMVGKKNQPILNSETIIKNAKNPKLHLFNVKRKQSSIPLNDVTGTWTLTNPQNVANFSAVAYQFGNMIQEKLNVPVGIIVSSWGGTPIRAWMSKNALEQIPQYASANDKADFRRPSVLYNAMLAPLTSYSVAGFLWYQGENDRRTSGVYKKALPIMVEQWREDWNNKNLPFYYVQIAPWYYRNDNGKQFAPLMREAQLEASTKIKNGEIVITSDLGSDKTIHPPDKTTVARRLANIALNETYGEKRIDIYGPDFKSFKVKANKVILKFNNNDGLNLTDEISKNFEIAGKDKMFYPAEAIINNGKLILTSSEVEKPVAARYGFKNYFEGNLFNKAGLPASSFRTDNWELNE